MVQVIRTIGTHVQEKLSNMEKKTVWKNSRHRNAEDKNFCPSKFSLLI